MAKNNSTKECLIFVFLTWIEQFFFYKLHNFLQIVGPNAISGQLCEITPMRTGTIWETLALEPMHKFFSQQLSVIALI